MTTAGTLAKAPDPGRQPLPGLPRRAGRMRRTGQASQWASAVYVIALLLVFFQSNVIERMASRLLPLAALAVMLTWRRSDVLTRLVPLSLAGFLLWAGASYLWSDDRSGSSIVLLGFFSSVIVAWCCGSFLTLEALHRLTTAVAKLLCLVTVAFLVVAPGLATRPAEDGAPGWHGPFSHKNGLGSFMVLALLCLWFDRRASRRVRAGWLALGVVLLIGSQSSSGLVLVLLAGAVLLWQTQMKKQLRRWPRIGWLGALISLLVAAVVIMLTSFDLVTGLLGRGTSLSGRTNIWAVVIERIQEKPFEGWGYGGMWRPASLASQSMWQEMRFHAYHAHSGYLDLLLQVGIVGLLLYLGFVVGGLRRHWQVRADPRHLWAALVMLTICLNAVTESAPFFSDGLLFLVAFAVVRPASPPLTPAITLVPSAPGDPT